MEEEFAASQLVDDMEVVDNFRKPIAVYSSGTLGMIIIDVNDEYVIYDEGNFAYHRAEVIDGDYFMVGEIKVPLDECMRV